MDPTSTNTPKISVVIASKVGPPFIDQCLKSIEKETKELGAEAIVVIPEGNSDAARIATEFPWTRVIKASEREVPALRGRGVDEARGELVAVIEPKYATPP